MTVNFDQYLGLELMPYFFSLHIKFNDGIKLWVGPWKGSKFQFSRGPQNWAL